MTAAATRAIGVVALDRANYGRTVIERPRMVQAYAAGGYVQQVAAAVQAGMQGMTLYSTLDGKPFKAMIIGAMRETGRLVSRSV